MSLKEQIEIELGADINGLKRDLGYGRSLVLQYTETVNKAFKKVTKEHTKNNKKMIKELRAIRKELGQNDKAFKKSATVTKKAARSSISVLSEVKSSLIDMTTQIVVLGGAFAAVGIIRMADSYKLVNDRIALVTSTLKKAYPVQQQVMEIANEARITYGGAADTYARIARNTQEMNISDKERLDLTEAISKSLIISGAKIGRAHV